jgi:hypothetical protein
VLEEDSESSCEVTIDYNARQPVFFTDMEREVEDLKQELNVDGYSNIYFIRGNFYDYYQEDEFLGEGTTGVVKKCTKIGTKDEFAVKMVQYRNDLEILSLV